MCRSPVIEPIQPVQPMLAKALPDVGWYTVTCGKSLKGPVIHTVTPLDTRMVEKDKLFTAKFWGNIILCMYLTKAQANRQVGRQAGR